MKKASILLFSVMCFLMDAQEYKNYDWGKPETYKPAENEKDLGKIVFFNKTISEFTIDGKENYDYLIRHIKTFVNSDEAIEKNNKVYIPLRSQNEEIVKQKIRVIKPNGTTVEMKDSDVMESVDERTRTKMKYFALKGLEKNAVIEQLVVTKLVPRLSGTTILLQDEDLNKNISYELIYPKHLEFAVKSYSNLPEFTTSTTAYKDKISKKLEVASIPALHDEEYANYNANAQKFSYKLAANYYTGKKDLFGYKQYTEDIFKIIDEKPDSKTDREVEKFVKLIPTGNSVQEKIYNVEKYIKKNINYDEHADEIDIATTLKNKSANSLGMYRLYDAVFNKMNIKHQPILVSDRFKTPIDPKFELYKSLDDFAIYFPETKGYIAPSEIDVRYPNLPFRWTNSNALFLSKTEFGGASIPDYDIRKIPTPSVEFTHDEMDINIDFTKNAVKPSVKTRIQFNGYSAMGIQPYYDFVPTENIPMFEKDLAENYTGQKENVKITAENKGLENASKPFIFNAEFEGNSLVEKVGDKILFKLGQTIGRQTELYQKDKRQMPLEIRYPHAYKRTITIKLPAGYSAKNIDQIDSNFVVNNNGTESAKFSTNYEVKGSEIVINNVEFYKDVELPITAYDNYVKVINAAADFNKIVLVLEKK